MTLDQRHVPPGGELERFPRRLDGAHEVRDEHAGAREPGEQRRAARRIAVADQLERALERREARPGAVEMALRAGGRLEDRGGAPRVRLRAEAGERRLEQRELAFWIAERAGGLGGAGEHGDAVGAGQRLGVRHLVPQVERAVEQRRHLAVGVHALGGRRGAHRGGQRRRLVARRGEVMGDGGGGLRAGTVVEMLLQRPRQAQMQLGALGGKQVLLDDLAQERVAESRDAVVLHDQDVRVDGLAQRVAQRARLEVARLLQQAMIEPLPDGDEPQQLPHALGEPLDPQHQRVAQRVGCRAASVEPGRQQLLAEQRVAARAGPQPLQQIGRGRSPEDVGELLGQLVAGERVERDAERARIELQLGQQGTERVLAVQLVAPVGGDDQDPLAGQAASQERQRRSRRAVRPVQILDHEQDRALAAEAVEQRQQSLEQLRLAALAGTLRRGAESRQQRRDGRADRRGQRRVAAARERPERSHQREVRQLALPAEVDRLAGEHQRALVARAAHELRQ